MKDASTAITTINDMLRKGGGEHLRNMVESTVIELLASEKTRQCIEQEKRRNENREHSVFTRSIREVLFCAFAHI